MPAIGNPSESLYVLLRARDRRIEELQAQIDSLLSAVKLLTGADLEAIRRSLIEMAMQYLKLADLRDASSGPSEAAKTSQNQS